MTSKPTRMETALQLRDHALAILRRHGSMQPVGDAKFLMWCGDRFRLWLRTPFQQWETGPEVAAKSLAAKYGLGLDEAKYAATLHGLKQPEILPYCLSGGTDNKALETLGVTGYGFAPLRLPADLPFAPMFHGIDEKVPVESLRFGTRVLARLIDTC